jgi:hypothetical protein
MSRPNFSVVHVSDREVEPRRIPERIGVDHRADERANVGGAEITRREVLIEGG